MGRGKWCLQCDHVYANWHLRKRKGKDLNREIFHPEMVVIRRSMPSESSVVSKISLKGFPLQ